MKTDLQLQQDVLAELNWEPSINAANIGVSVEEGIVTLTGNVASFAEKWDAEGAAQRVSGVRALTVAMDIHLPGSCVRDDVDIARAVKNALLWSIAVPNKDLGIVVEGGHVTLAGEVALPYQRDAAVHSVRYLMGVTGVTDKILIKPHLTSGAVKEEIEATLKRRAQQDANQIAVTVHGSDVTLTGVVPNWTERALARHSAWHTPGVHNVIDKMTAC